ncbi:MAG: rhombosortase [Proteobacteria bacterium]|nr:rhombosortase [Pseudomonadota bacterium]
MTERAAAKFRSIRDRGLIGLAAFAALLVALSLGGDALVARLRYERAAIAAGEAWRLLTGQLVHHDARHLALNLAGLALLWLLYARDARPREWAVVGLASALAVGGLLYLLEPQIAWYLGLSGVLHGGWAAATVFGRRRWPLEANVSALLLAGKLVLERFGSLGAALDPGLPVITVAHLYGALGGLAAALALARRRASL